MYIKWTFCHSLFCLGAVRGSFLGVYLLTFWTWFGFAESGTRSAHASNEHLDVSYLIEVATSRTCLSFCRAQLWTYVTATMRKKGPEEGLGDLRFGGEGKGVYRAF